VLAGGGYVMMRRLATGPKECVDRLGAAGTFDLLAAPEGGEPHSERRSPPEGGERSDQRTGS